MKRAVLFVLLLAGCEWKSTVHETQMEACVETCGAGRVVRVTGEECTCATTCAKP